MTFNFLIQTTRVLHKGNYDETDLEMVYNYIITLDNEILNDYYNTCTILSYESDLHLYMEIVDVLIKIFEEREEYEKCDLLKNKKTDAIMIIQNNKL